MKASRWAWSSKRLRPRLAFHRVSRSVRLSVALELRLERDARAHAAEDRRLNLRAAAGP